jgi:hypothetical protein
MDHFLQLPGVGEVLLFVFDKLYQLVDLLVDQLPDGIHPHSLVLVPEDSVVKGVLLQQFGSQYMGGIIHVLLERKKLQEPFNEVNVAVVEGSCGDGCTSVV